MTLDEAIKQLENAPASIYSTYYPDFPEAVRLAEAIQLASEALKWRKHLESFDEALRNHPLPGETEE